MARAEQAVEPTVEPTAAQRLKTAQEGFQRLRAELAEVKGRKRAAQERFQALDAQLLAMHRRADVGGTVAQGVAELETQRAAATQEADAAGPQINDLERRIDALRDQIPRLEVAAAQDELAAAVEVGRASALRYRAALEGFIAAAIVFQSDLARCDRLSNGIVAKGSGPRANLRAHLVAVSELDRLLSAARENGGDPATVARLTGRLFERWRP